MSEKLREQISALVDDELPADENELLVRRFSMDRYLRICWEHYHLIGEAFRRELPQIGVRGFVDRVMDALDDEETMAKRHDAGAGSYIKKSATGMALAACVAVVAVYAIRNGNGIAMKSVPAPSEIVPTAASVQTGTDMYGMPSNAAWNGNVPEVQARLNNYVINHNEMATAIEQQGMLPYFYISSVQPRKSPRLLPASQKSPQQAKR